jgi:hypothetical protein
MQEGDLYNYSLSPHSVTSQETLTEDHDLPHLRSKNKRKKVACAPLVVNLSGTFLDK